MSDNVKVEIGLLVSSYFALLALSNLIISLLLNGFEENPIFYISYIISSLILLYGYSKLGVVHWSFERYRNISRYIRIFSWFSLSIIIFLYFQQGMPELIKFRTDNHHSLGIIWLLLNLFIIVSPFSNEKRSLLFPLIMSVGVLLTGSRLYLLVFVVFNVVTFGFSLKSWKTFFLFLGTISVSSVLAILREGLDGKISSSSFVFFIYDIFERNVALNNGLNLLKKSCSDDLEIGSPLTLLLPRVLYEGKLHVFNVRAFMCYFDKSIVPEKSSGFFLAEYFIGFGSFWGPLSLITITAFYTLVLLIIYKSVSNLIRLLLFPLLIFSAFGPIDGIYSSSIQMGILILLLGFSYAILPKRKKYFYNAAS